ncbi:MAG: hypothetical protein ABFR95_00275 [Actinomycetota bacterium]
METMTLIHTTKTNDLMAMSKRELEAWFDAGGLTVELVANCPDTMCSDCITLEPAQTAA